MFLKTNNPKKIQILSLLTLLFSILFIFLNLNFKYLTYGLSNRIPRLVAIFIAVYCIAKASIIFQTIINNVIVTPCLLGMNALYLTIHTAIVFFLGSSSILISNQVISFTIDLLLMIIISTFLYGYLFKKTKYNILFILLSGTVMATFFNSLQQSMIRLMDPNEYDSLLNSLVANFNNVNESLLIISIILIIMINYLYRNQIKLVDILILGKNQCINLGINYDQSVKSLLSYITILISIATALVGPISFLGLIIANLSRQLFCTYQHTTLIKGACLIGIIIILWGQIMIDQIFLYSIPISVLINILGGLYFLYLLIKRKRL